jgi:hypothetical protein
VKPPASKARHCGPLHPRAHLVDHKYNSAFPLDTLIAQQGGDIVGRPANNVRKAGDGAVNCQLFVGQ